MNVSQVVAASVTSGLLAQTPPTASTVDDGGPDVGPAAIFTPSEALLSMRSVSTAEVVAALSTPNLMYGPSGRSVPL